MENSSKLGTTEKPPQNLHNDSAYGGYELLKTLLIEEEELNEIKMDDVIVKNTKVLIESSGGNGNIKDDC